MTLKRDRYSEKNSLVAMLTKGEQGSRGAEEQGSGGAEEQGSRGAGDK